MAFMQDRPHTLSPEQAEKLLAHYPTSRPHSIQGRHEGGGLVVWWSDRKVVWRDSEGAGGQTFGSREKAGEFFAEKTGQTSTSTRKVV